MAGKYQAYPEYKDSGVEWLGEISEHWTVLPAKRLFKLVAEPAPNNNDLELLSVYTEIGVRPRKDLEQKGNKASTKDGYWIVKKGDLIVNKLLAWMGAVGYSDYNGVTSPAYDILRSKRDFNPRFYHYLFRSEIAQKEFKRWSRGIMEMRLRLYFEELGRISIPFPPEEEIEKITDFLDYETAQIDTLIDKQQQLIQLLKEKRQAVINHAVTKGLNPDAPMKDSGIEWLGEVPEHWNITRLKYHTNCFEQGWSPQCESRPALGDEYGVLKVGCVNHGVFKSSENKVLPADLEPQLQYLIKKDDLLISRANTKELVGSAAVVDMAYENLILCDKLYRLRFGGEINPKWVSNYLSLPVIRQQIEINATGASHSMQNIGQSTIKELPILMPPSSEVIEIIEVISNQSDSFDLVLLNARRQIELLQERRSALIAAAVTGKIDVRGWQPPAKSQPC